MDIGKLQPVIIILVAIAGLGLGYILPSDFSSEWFIQAPLMALLFVLFLSVDFGNIGAAARNVRFTACALTLNFILTPIVAYVLGIVFFGGNPDIRIGLLMLLVTPCTDWYLVFTNLGRGNVELGMSILPLNLILQVVLLPVYLSLFFGTSAGMDIPSLLFGMAVVLIVPLVLAAAVRLTIGRRERFRESVSDYGDNLQLLFLCIAVLFMFASEGEEVVSNPVLFVELFVPLLLFFGLLFILSRFVGNCAGFDRRDTVSLTFTSMARNSPLALAIAAGTFSDQPLIILALVIGPLIELPVLTIASWATAKWVGSESVCVE